MRIVSPNASARTAAPAAPRRAATGGFSVAESEAGRTANPVATLRTIGGIDALMALQGQDEQTERRRRAVTRGRTALDALDQLKAELLAGAPASATILRLKSASAELTAASGDEKLDSVLAEIDLRLAVEIAKMTPR